MAVHWPVEGLYGRSGGYLVGHSNHATKLYSNKTLTHFFPAHLYTSALVVILVETPAPVLPPTARMLPRGAGGPGRAQNTLVTKIDQSGSAEEHDHWGHL